MSTEDPNKIEMDAPENVEYKDGIVTVYIGNDDKIISEKTMSEEFLRVALGLSSPNEIKEEFDKSFQGSNQSKKEIGDSAHIEINAIDGRIQEPPIDPECMRKLLEVSDVHCTAVKTKVRDVIGTGYCIKAKYPIKKDSEEPADSTHGLTITEEQFQKDCIKIQNFIDKCDDVETFEEICYKVGMDREAIGWSGFEVIRQGDGKIARLQHIPANRLKVLEGFSGFVEELPADTDTDTGLLSGGQQYTYYQPFGHKVGVWIDDPFDIGKKPKKIFRPYDPDLDGELEIGQRNIEYNLVSKKNGDRLKGGIIRNFKDAANEVLFLPNTHSSSRYYGFSDVVPAIGAILANVHIRNYLLQFFEHNCVPRYAVIIKGASVDDEFLSLITDFFENKVKQSEHKTMILALTGFGNKNVEVQFQKLDSDRKEADFIETKKSNDQIIMIAHQIPPSVLAVHETSSLGTGSGFSQSETYKNRVVVPRQIFWANRLNRLFRLGLGCRYAEIEFDPFDLRDGLQLAQILNILLLNGVLSINEARRQLGIPGSIEGGDIPILKSREGSIIPVNEIPNLTAKLREPNLMVEEDPDTGQKIVDIDKFISFSKE